MRRVVLDLIPRDVFPQHRAQEGMSHLGSEARFSRSPFAFVEQVDAEAPRDANPDEQNQTT